MSNQKVINIPGLVLNFGNKYITQTDNNDDQIVSTTLYWSFRDFVFKNIIIPNSIKVDMSKFDKEKILELFTNLIFESEPVTLKKSSKDGWIGFSLTDFRKKNKKKNNNNRLINEFTNSFVIRTDNKRNKIFVSDIWDTFREWWVDTTGKNYDMKKKQFIGYVVSNIFDESPKEISKDGSLGWTGFILKLPKYDSDSD